MVCFTLKRSEGFKWPGVSDFSPGFLCPGLNSAKKIAQNYFELTNFGVWVLNGGLYHLDGGGFEKGDLRSSDRVGCE